ncbi:MAG: hypothetical protein LQ352_007253 [Teloschistes flavicans]|nr:MAG: hypothetical protein LQ352_007253 [Teloschistes flavicans]
MSTLIDHLAPPGLPPIQYLLVIALFAVLDFIVAGGIYRLYFSPLAKFPGPKLAALTYWYEFYYDLIQGGRFQSEIARMHKKYGPIVRINCNELHIQDTEFYDTFYRRNRLDKYTKQTKMFGTPDTHFTTNPHELHRLRRAPLAQSFSKKAVLGMSSTVEERIAKLCSRLQECRAQRKLMPLGLGYVALTVDIISSYALADCFHLLEREDLGADHYHSILSLIQSAHFIKHFPAIYGLMRKLPKYLVTLLQPKMKSTLNIVQVREPEMQDGIKATIQDIQRGSCEHNTSVFARLLESDLPPQEKFLDRLGREGMVLIIAGSEATAQTLSVITYHLLTNPDKLAKLQKQLQVAIPDPSILPSVAQLEYAPYLHACVQEGLRFAHGIAGRLTRVSQDPMVYQGWKILPGTPVGMTSVFMHEDESIFPNHKEFKPERWLDAKGSGSRLERYLVNFGRGTRQCIGISLAYAELYMTIATIFRRFELELFETDASAVEYSRDFFNAMPEKRGDGLKVCVK